MLKKRKAYRINSQVYAYKTDLSPELLTETMVSDFGTEELFSDIEHISFYQTNKTLSKGDVLKAKDMIPKTLVKYGKKVKVLLNRGEIKLRLNGVARGSGAFGENIDIFNTSSKKILSAKIIDNNTVMVEL